MAAFDFPNSPSTNDTHTENGVQWKYNGYAWDRVESVGEKGVKGQKGEVEKGEKGEEVKGQKGEEVKGQKGEVEKGQKGEVEKGEKGDKGFKGDEGPIGVAGLDIDTGPPSNPTAGDLWWDSDDGDLHVYYNDGNSSQWVAVSQGPAGSPGAGNPAGSNTQLQINDNGAFGGSNLRYNSTTLDGSLEFSNTAGDVHARISCYHDTISGGNNALYFYADLGIPVLWNLKVDNNSVEVAGAFSKGSGSFKIPHPLPALKDTKNLVHSFIEGPQCDNLYRGKVDLVGGTATVNLDTKSDMTTGTFVALNRDVQCFTTNETGWTAVKGSVSGNILTITAQDNTCTDTISWMVVGERQDDNIKSSILTDANGKLIMEPNQIPSPPTS